MTNEHTLITNKNSKPNIHSIQKSFKIHHNTAKLCLADGTSATTNGNNLAQQNPSQQHYKNNTTQEPPYYKPHPHLEH